jgi:hypothetical protein
MSPEEALLARCNDPDYLVITGSRLYGTAKFDADGKCISDTDLRGVVIPPWEYLTDIRSSNWDGERELAKPPEGDHKIYGLRKFITLLLKADPQLLEVLFVPDSHVLKMTGIGEFLREQRHLFVTKIFYYRIVGYGNSEWRKAKGEKYVVKNRPKDIDQIIADLRNLRKYPKEKMDEIVEILESEMEREIIPSLSGVSTKRKLEFEEFGYTCSSACHALRLLYQCTELLKTGEMTFPRPEAAILTEIKHGRMPIEKIEELRNKALIDCDDAFAKTKLPEKPQTNKVLEWYNEVVLASLAMDDRFRGELTKAICE